jgi:hypothetical protein
LKLTALSSRAWLDHLVSRNLPRSTTEYLHRKRHRPPRHEASEYSTAVRTPFKYSTSNTDSVTDVDRSIQTEYGTTIYKAPEAGGLLLFSDKVAQKGRISKKLNENPVP